MDYLKGWLKTILYMNVLLLVCDSLIRKTKYEKYLRFFSGFLMMLCLIQPLIDLTGAGTYMDASYIQTALKNELSLVGENDDLQAIKREVQEEYDAAIKNQICQTAENYRIEVTKINIRWNSKGDTMKKIDITGKNLENTQEGAQINAFRETLIQFYQLEDSNINIEIQE